jgi:hypothetical protein
VNEQRRILDHYLKLKKFPVLKKIADDTNIQLTRVHRLLKGHEMKLHEYLKFKEIVSCLSHNIEDRVIEQAKQASEWLDTKTLEDFMKELEQKIKMRKIFGGGVR